MFPNFMRLIVLVGVLTGTLQFLETALLTTDRLALSYLLTVKNDLYRSI